jgi:hypothetical protein
MRQGGVKGLRLAAAESNLRELSALLDECLEVEADICRRIRDGGSDGNLANRNLTNQAKRYGRIIGRVLDEYFLALDEYLAAVLDAEVEPGGGGSNGSPHVPRGLLRDKSVL